MTEESGLIPDGDERFFLLHNVQTGRGADPPFHTMGTGGLYPRISSGRSVKLAIHLYLVPRLKMVEIYLHCFMHFYGMVLI
jgi:hypothetical protein